MIRPQLVTTPPDAGPASDMLFERVVLGVDFGAASLAAARWATAHVARGAHAILSHVVPCPEPSRDDDGEGMLRMAALREMLPALAGGLGGFAATLDLPSARTVLRIGLPSRWLSTIANGAEASLVILGRRGDADRKRIGEPNVIERLARRTGASVLVVPEGTTEPPRHVLAAVDAGPFAPAVLRIARALARLHTCPLTVLHVLSPAAGAYDRVIRTARTMMGERSRRRVTDQVLAPSERPAQTARWLEELVRAQRSPGADRVEVAVGDPAREIAATAAAHGSPLVVVGQRGADDAPPGSLGSVARELLTRAPMPVLAVSDV